MLDFIMGIGFALVIEGVLWGLFPRTIIKMVKMIEEHDEHTLRYIGVTSLAIGVLIIWYVQSVRIS